MNTVQKSNSAIAKIGVIGVGFVGLPLALTKETLSQYDCVVILTDHLETPPYLIIKNSSLIYDTRNVTKNYKEKSNIIRFGSDLL